MKVIYYLSTCDTCKRILKELQPIADSITLQDIKKEPITETNLATMYNITKSYEALLNKRAQLYKQRNLKDQQLTELDIKELLLEHYTFLKRPVIVLDNNIFVGNSKQTVEAAKAALHE